MVEALPESDGSVALSLRSGVELDEGLMPAMVCQNLTPGEIVYAAARSAGFAIANIKIHGLDDLPLEAIWVLAPVAGVRVDRTLRIGVVEFMDPAAGQAVLRRFTPPLEPVFTEPLANVSAFARVAVAARLSYEAEQEGLALIDTAAAWLTTRLRYSWSHSPDGDLQHYERAPTRTTVERREGVGVFAVDGPRRWWRKGTTMGRGGRPGRARAGHPLDRAADAARGHAWGSAGLARVAASRHRERSRPARGRALGGDRVLCWR